MADPHDLIVVHADGSIETASRGADRRLRDEAGRYRLMSEIPGLLLLFRDGDEPRVPMAGQIVGRMTMMEVLNILATSGWRGELHVVDDDTRRSLVLDQGALKKASSNAPQDRLGEILLRQGVLDRDDLDNTLRQITQDRRLGELCVEQGLIDAQQLYASLQAQAQHIFFETLITAKGHYVFRMPGNSAEPAGPIVHVSIQSLLMEGVQRIDEMALFRDKIPSSGLAPRRKMDSAPVKLGETAVVVFEAVDGRNTIDDIARITSLGEFETTKAIYHLLQQGAVDLTASSAVDPSSIERLVMQFNEVMQDIFMAVATYGGIDQTKATLDAWIEGSGYGPFFGRGVDDTGSLDAALVAKALQGFEQENPLEALYQALHELAAFALFSATTTLPRGQELALARDVNARLKAIRLGA